MPIIIDLWKWFYDFRATARWKNDSERLRLFQHFDTGVWHRHRDPDQALAAFEKGVELSRRLKEPYWEVFFQYWCCEIFVHSAKDLERGLERCIQTFILAHKPGYLNCPVLGRVYRILTDVYYIIDAEGSADKMREMVDYMLKNVPIDNDTYLLLQRRRAGLHYTFEEWDDAEREALHYLNLSNGQPFRESDAYHFLWNVATRKKEHDRAYAYAVQLEKTAENNTSVTLEYGFSLLAQALYQLTQDNKEEAERFYNRAMAVYDDHKAIRSLDFYDVACAYHEKLGDAEKALSLRNQQLKELIDTASHSFEIHCRLKRCRLLGRMGKTSELKAALADAYEATKKLRKPEFYVRRFQRVENGEYGDE